MHAIRRGETWIRVNVFRRFGGVIVFQRPPYSHRLVVFPPTFGFTESAHAPVERGAEALMRGFTPAFIRPAFTGNHRVPLGVFISAAGYSRKAHKVVQWNEIKSNCL